jgi:hypothetical protein
MHVNRLRDLSSYLHKLEDQRNHQRAQGLRVESICSGSAGNAIRYAAEWYHFQGQGLLFERIEGECRLVPRFEGLTGPDAIERFFEIDDFTRQVFFDAESYDESLMTSPGAVADRIDRWLATEPIPKRLAPDADDTERTNSSSHLTLAHDRPMLFDLAPDTVVP